MSASARLITEPPKAILTDVFGTVVNWRKTVIPYLERRAHEALNSPSASIPSAVRLIIDGVSWSEFAERWRQSYGEFCSNYPAPPTKRLSFKTVDQHHLESLFQLIAQYQIEGLWTNGEVVEISLIWHELEAWPDSVRGLEKLDKKFITATLSNGNRSLLKDLYDYNKIPVDQIISAEDFGMYKPQPDVYLGAATCLNVKPSECCLVAAHLGDLKAAKRCGYKTVYVEREGEETFSREDIERARKDGTVDLWIEMDQKGFLTLASILDS